MKGGHYFTLGDHFASHESVSHKADEYVCGSVHTNTLEGFYSIFKRGMKGVYKHCSEKHLHRYVAEFDFRYNARAALGVEDAARTTKVLSGSLARDSLIGLVMGSPAIINPLVWDFTASPRPLALSSLGVPADSTAGFADMVKCNIAQSIERLFANALLRGRLL
jgi:hypothetical protein